MSMVGLISALSRGMAAILFVFASGIAAAEPSAAKPISSAFESTVTKVTVKPGEESITVEWSYTNHWDFPLAVENFDTSCGCLSGKSGHPILAPGQSGKLSALLTPGQHRGILRKSLHVRFVGHEQSVELVMETTIPSHVELSTQELVWKSGEKPEAKVIEIKSGTGKPFLITSLPGLPDGQFQVTSETLTPGTHYRVHITPMASAVGQHCMQVRTDSPDPRDQVMAVFLRVDPPSS